jgi:hypothetical protein
MDSCAACRLFEALRLCFFGGFGPKRFEEKLRSIVNGVGAKSSDSSSSALVRPFTAVHLGL